MKNTPPALRRVPLFALAFTSAALALSGCGHKDTIVGKWQGTVAQPGGTVNSTFEFTSDGKETIGIDSPAAAGRKVVVGGTYTVDGTNLTQTLTTMTMNGQALPIPPSQVQPQSGSFTLDGDHLTVTRPGSKDLLSLTRVK